MEPNNNWIKSIRAKIAKGKLEEAIKLFFQEVDGKEEYKGVCNQLTTISASFKEFQKQFIKGTLPKDSITREEITARLTELLQSVESGDFSVVSTSSDLTKPQNPTYVEVTDTKIFASFKTTVISILAIVAASVFFTSIFQEKRHEIQLLKIENLYLSTKKLEYEERVNQMQWEEATSFKECDELKREIEVLKKQLSSQNGE